ncbi:toll/interleukin-1 receptor domain-containing protein [Parafrankia sp. FMc2]
MGSGEDRWDFFVSYAESDEAWAEWCAWHLEEAGCSVLLEKWDVLPGEFWVARRDAGARHSERVVALLSPAYLSFGLPPTTHSALNEERLIPIRVAPCQVTGLLATVAGIDLVGLSQDDAHRRLLQWARTRNASRLKPSTAPPFPGLLRPTRPRSAALPVFPGRPAGGPWGGLAAVCDELAREVEHQLGSEVDGPSLPVRWKAADPRHFDDEAGPPELTGVAKPADVLRRVPSGRLVVLGEAGAGKSRLLRSISADLLRERAKVGLGTVPVLLPLASWNPDQAFQSWVEGELHGYRALQQARRAGVVDAADQLIRERQLLLLLDGLDEMPAPVRSRALAAIGCWQQPGQTLVLASRVWEYEDAVDPVGEGGGCIRGAAGIVLCPIEVDDAIRWLKDIAGERSRRAWEPVIERLRSEPGGPLARTLANPLMLTLAAIRAEVSGARDLVTRRLVLPILDRLEDMPAPLRPHAMAKLNAWLVADENSTGLVLSTDEPTFRAGMPPGGMCESPLNGAVAVRLLPLDLDQAEQHLTGASSGQLAVGWHDLLDQAARQPASPVGLALRTPLLLSLMQDVLRQTGAARPNAGEFDHLLDRQLGHPAPGRPGNQPPGEEPSATLSTVRDWFVTASLASAYASETQPSSAGSVVPRDRPPPPDRALAALRYLTYGLSRDAGPTSIAWWEIQAVVPRVVIGAPLVVAGLGLGFVMFGWFLMPVGLVCCIPFGTLLTDRRRSDMWVPRPRAIRLLRTHPDAPGRSTWGQGPRAVWRHSRAHALSTAPLLLALYSCCTSYCVQTFVVGGRTSASWWAATLAGSAVWGVAGAIGVTAWGRYTVARLWLTRARGMPADLMAVLEDAQARGVLVLTGDVWEFRQAAVGRQLAAADPRAAPPEGDG